MKFVVDFVLPVVVGGICGVIYAFFLKKVFEEESFLIALLKTATLFLIITSLFVFSIYTADDRIMRVLIFVVCMCITRAVLSMKMILGED